MRTLLRDGVLINPVPMAQVAKILRPHPILRQRPKLFKIAKLIARKAGKQKR